MRWPAALLFGMALVALGSGCRSCDPVESELRAREQDVRELREELERSQLYNQALQQELGAVRGEPCTPDAKPVAAYPVRSVALGRQTGGRPSDHGPGDDALQVLLEPRDPEGQAIKAPGSLVVQAIEVNPQGLKTPLSAWEIPPDQLRRAWRSGLFTNGYSLTLPWKVYPSTEKLRVVAQFRTADGRLFEADKDITVRLTPEAQRKPLPPADGGPVLPAPNNVLPPPHPLEPGANGGAEAARFTPAGQGHTTSTSLWHKAVPPPAAEILRPVPVEAPATTPERPVIAPLAEGL